MTDRLSSLDVSFLYLEDSSTVLNVGTVMIIKPLEQVLDVDHLVRHVGARLAYVPRYRQRVRFVPGGIANPVWVDDENFDLSYHVRRSAIPRPGTRDQLAELVSRLHARPLDRNRPLWELNVVEGLEGGHVAIVTKVHQALVDGVHALDLGQVLLDDDDGLHEPTVDTWRPHSEPSTIELLGSAIVENVRRPGAVAERVRSGVGDLRATATKAVSTFGGLVSAARTATTTAPRGPLNQPLSEHRRYTMVDTDLADYRAIRSRHQARANRSSSSVTVPELTTTVTDVVLATLTGALRAWLLTRGEGVTPATTVRALVPVSLRRDDVGPAGAVGGDVTSLLVDLPVGEASPAMRLHQVAYQTKAHRDTGQGLDARAIAGLTGFAAPTLHSLGARVAAGLSRRLYSVVITNVPGPQQRLYLDGSEMVRAYPTMPLFRHHVLTVGVTSYNGGVFYGLTADRDAMPDLEVLAQCILDSLAELRESA